LVNFIINMAKKRIAVYRNGRLRDGGLRRICKPPAKRCKRRAAREAVNPQGGEIDGRASGSRLPPRFAKVLPTELA
jgi:hypothetical protein